MAAKNPSFNYSICMACNVCSILCPMTCIEMSKVGIDVLKNAYPVLASPEKCTGCSICSNACPVQAITMEAVAVVAA